MLGISVARLRISIGISVARLKKLKFWLLPSDGMEATRVNDRVSLVNVRATCREPKKWCPIGNIGVQFKRKILR